MQRFMDEAEMRRSTKLWSLETVEAMREGASDAAVLEATTVWNISVTVSSVFVAGEGVVNFVERQSRDRRLCKGLNNKWGGWCMVKVVKAGRVHEGTEDMDARLLHCMIEESRIGNRVDGSWTSQAYSNIVDHLHSAGGFAWNPVSMTFHAEDEVWMDLIQSRPPAAKWRVNSIKHYDLMVKLWAADRAIGSGVRTARQARRQRVGPRVSVDLNQNVEYIPEQPQWAGYRDPTPPSPPSSVDEYSPGQTQSVPSVPSGRTSSSRGSKRKAPMVDVIDSQFDKLTTSLDGFANVLSSSNVHFGVISDAAVRQVSAMQDINEILRSQTEIIRRTPNYTYTEADIYDMLSAMNIANEIC
ncbi:uncharacterized protein HKW66_Vig0223840 [Vigna angularis]|uniref:Myb/SANT-like domain-containing protein n=1 Tax=Phaseolus angularis TaxID=3914 RepID=A0A8T0JZF9_PHAAN|nr:uncharacterized protein HKW66_Vig0223840 [Vigna angularis]